MLSFPLFTTGSWRRRIRGCPLSPSIRRHSMQKEKLGGTTTALCWPEDQQKDLPRRRLEKQTDHSDLLQSCSDGEILVGW